MMNTYECENRMCNFKCHFCISGMALFQPWDEIEQEIKAFCYREGIECKIFKSGLFFKNWYVEVKGKCLFSKATRIKESFIEFLKQFN